MTIVLFDATGGPSPGSGVTRKARNGRSLTELPTSGTDVVAVGTAAVDPADVDWASARATFASEPNIDAVVLGTGTNDVVARAWARLPNRFAMAAVDPTRTALIAFRSHVLETAEDDDSWRLLFHRDPQRVTFVGGAGQGGAHGLPPLSPAGPRTLPDWLMEFIGNVPVATVRAGLLQMHDHLDASHTVAQEAGNVDGDYWHAIMHRREPDPSNATYWFRRVGSHAVFGSLSEAAAPYAEMLDLPAGDWDPNAFVDVCERARKRGDSSASVAARHLQWIEMLLLLDHCIRQSP